MKDKVLLIGWSSAIWALLDTLISEGELPNLKRLKESSTYCTLRSPDPSMFLSNWTSVITGCTNIDHGVSRRVNIRNGKIFPLSHDDVKKKNIFEIAADNGLKSIQISVPLSHPFPIHENIFGASEYAHYTNIDSSSGIDLVKLKATAISADIISEKLALFFDVNDIKTIRDNYDFKYSLILEFIEESLLCTEIFKELSKTIDWSLCGIVYQQIEHILFHFLEYIPSLNVGSSNLESQYFKHVVKAAFTLLDSLLSEILAQIDADTNVYLVSPNGFKANKNWIKEYKATIESNEYSEQGLWLLNGKDYKAKEIHFDANILDVAPTIMAALHIPQSKDWKMGKIFLEKINLDKEENLKSYNKVENRETEYTFPNHIQDLFLEKLHFIHNKKNIAVSDIKETQEYLLARSYIVTGRTDKAFPIMDSLWRQNRYNQWYGARLIGLHLSNNNVELANNLIDEVLKLGGKIEELHLIKANMLIQQKKFRSASGHLEIAGENKCELEGIYGQIASCYARLNFPKQANNYFKKELELSKHPKNYFGYGNFLMQQKRIKQAIRCFDKVVEIIPKHPLANFNLGLLLYQSKEFQRAADVLEIVKSTPPSAEAGQKAHQTLVDIYKNKLNRQDKIEEMRDAYEKSIGSLGNIIIVSGLPRSGTSMMMQMLLEGGVDVFTDGKRSADENNSRGYLEHEAIKNLAKEKNFLVQANGKAVKVISHLLKHLPHVFKYKIIFMDRDINEVMKSQSKMLKRLGKERKQSVELLNSFEQSRAEAIKWCKTNSKYVDLLLVSYNDIIARPIHFANDINLFLDNKLEVRAMASIVDKSLYREKHDDGKTNR